MMNKLKGIFSILPSKKKEGVLSLRAIFEKFRQLLEYNNRALELIADMGDKLSGDYLFDKQYIYSICQELDENIFNIIYNLNLISRKKYLKLFDVFAKIQASIKAELESQPVISKSSYLIPFEEITRDISDKVGEKMATLGELRNRLGMKVPEGFAFSASAYKQFMEYNHIDRMVEELSHEAYSHSKKQLDEICERIIELILRGKMPPDLEKDLKKNISLITKKNREERRFAVRSSALGEDGEISFAGQYKTVLNVPPAELSSAYREVLASLFAPHVISYRLEQRKALQEMAMAVGCMVMVSGTASGVIYTLNPATPQKDTMVISASWGLGKIVVEGEWPADQFEISREPPHGVVAKRIAKKEKMYVVSSGGGVALIDVPEEKQGIPSLSDTDLARLAEKAIRIENYLKCFQDIEWCINEAGGIFILQARPLRISFPKNYRRGDELKEAVKKYRILMQDKGVVACRGIGAGKIFRVDSESDFNSFPQGAVLLLKHTSPRMSTLIPKASAAITEVGSSTGHFATIAREFRVPTIVDTGEATKILKAGMEVTVDAEENIIYEGVVKELLKFQLLGDSCYEDAPEFRILRRILKKVAPLNLTDPQKKEFSPSYCATYHDIIRFAHEMAIREISEQTSFDHRGEGYSTKKLNLPIPLDLTLIDLGDGILPESSGPFVEVDKIACSPLRILVETLTTPGVWQSEPLDLDIGGFISSFTRTIPFDILKTSKIDQNLAIISKEYLNLSLRLGYHFNMVDCYLSDNRNDNYIYFRFVGGVTEITRRSRRARLISSILEKIDFVVENKGDLVIARTKKMSREEMEERIRMIGRLIGFTRQLDILLRTEGSIEEYVKLFFERG